MQIYRRSTLTISGFNVIFILQSPKHSVRHAHFDCGPKRRERGVGGKQIFYCPPWRIWLPSSQVYCESGKKGICGVKTRENFFIVLFLLSLVFLFLLASLFFSPPSLFLLLLVVLGNPFGSQVFIWFVLSCSDLVWWLNPRCFLITLLINPDQDGVAVDFGSVLGRHSNLKLYICAKTEFFFVLLSPSLKIWDQYL